MAVGQPPPTDKPPAGSGGSEPPVPRGAVVTEAPPDELPAPDSVVVIASAEVLANTLPEYVRAWWQRVKAGDSGVLPVVVGLVVIVAVFEIRTSLYLSAGNIVNLFNQAVVFIMFAIGEVFVLLLGGIDLSMVFVAGIGAGLIAALVAPPYNLPWWLAVLAGCGATTAIGLLQGVLITRLKLPSFIVTLAGYVAWQGVMIWMFDTFPIAVGGVISISNRVLLDIVGGSMSPAASWIVMIVVVGAFGIFTVWRDLRRRSQGLVTAPLGLTLLKVVAVAVAGVVIVLICNVNRGTGSQKVAGVPWSMPVLLVVFIITSFLLARTRFGRYIYAIGGNAEAARRAGIDVRLIRTAAFGITGLMAGIAGLMYLSQIGSIATDIDPTYVLYAIAAAVIGGTSLYGGRGKPLHAVLGGLVIAAVYNGIYLIGLGAAATYIVTGVVLLVALTVDSVARRGGARAGA